jgi:UDP-N-acetylmuramate--alanine ligase
MMFPSGTRVHIVGVAGAGMSGVARLLADWGCVVSGSDASDSPVLAALARAGVQVFSGHNERYGADATVVLWSPAVREDHTELLAARQRGATLIPRAQLFAELAQQAHVIGLTGTHGKTTATSMMAHVMAAAGRDDGRLVGADIRGLGPNGYGGTTGQLVVEVDESFGTFTHLTPSALGVLNVDADHLDHYGNLATLEAAFSALCERTTGPVVIWSDDAGCRRVATNIERSVRTVGTQDDVDWHVRDIVVSRRGSSFTIAGPTTLVIELCVTGAHNVANAAVVAALALELGVSAPAVRSGLARFEGAPRRYEYRGQWRGIDVYEDYAHLPGEIGATLHAARESGYERIACIFQPHRYTRTAAVGDAFAPAFDEADVILITDIYGAGEPNPAGLTGERVADPLRRRRGEIVHYCPDALAIKTALDEVSADVLFVLGAGDIAGCLDDLDLVND